MKSQALDTLSTFDIPPYSLCRTETGLEALFHIRESERVERHPAHSYATAERDYKKTETVVTNVTSARQYQQFQVFTVIETATCVTGAQVSG